MTLLSEIATFAKEFEEKHGGPTVFDPDTGRVLYRDGASRLNQQVLGGTQYFEPPAELPQQLKLMRRYLHLRIEAEETARSKAKNEWASSLPMNAVAELQAWRQRIDAIRAELAAVEHEIAQLPEERARAAYLERHRQQAQVQQQLAMEIWAQD